jgi:hypothetical protein
MQANQMGEARIFLILETATFNAFTLFQITSLPVSFPFFSPSIRFVPFHSVGTSRSLSFVSSHPHWSLVISVQCGSGKHFLKPSEVIKHWKEARKCVIRVLTLMLMPFGSCAGKNYFERTVPRSPWDVWPKEWTATLQLVHTREEKTFFVAQINLSF